MFDRPVQGRHFFEAVIRENLDLGRPDRISLLFPRRITRRTPPPRHGYRTRVITTGIAPSLHVEYEHTDVKQYFKQERALRTETTIDDPTDFQAKKALETLPHLRAAGARVNEQLLAVERVSHACSLDQDALERLQSPRLQDGQRIPALRFGDPRVLALLQALCGFAHLLAGFRNRDLRPQVAALLGRDLTTYSRGAMTYDLRRLRLHGLIERASVYPHELRPPRRLLLLQGLPPHPPPGLCRPRRSARRPPPSAPRRPPTPRPGLRPTLHRRPASPGGRLNVTLSSASCGLKPASADVARMVRVTLPCVPCRPAIMGQTPRQDMTEQC